MARKTDGEKIDELEKLVAALIERVDNLRKDVDAADAARRITLVEHQLAELKKNQEKWGQRIWMIVAPLVAAIIGSLLTYLLKP